MRTTGHDDHSAIRKRYRKPLREPLDPVRVQRLSELDQFHRTVNGWVFRCVHFHDISEKHLAMEAIRGRALKHALAHAGGPFATARSRNAARNLAVLAGKWLGYFHTWEPRRKPRSHDVGSLVQRTVEKVNLLSKVGLPEPLARRIRAALEEARREQPDHTEVTVHGDFKPSNLMVTGNEIVGIDMEGYHRGHPLTDLGSFIAACNVLRSSALLRSYCPTWSRLVCREFLAGYRSVTEWNQAGLRLQLLKNVVALFEYMSRRYAYPIWLLRGRPLMVRTISDLLEHSFTDAWDDQDPC